MCQDDHEEDEGEDNNREKGIVDAQEYQCFTIRNLRSPVTPHLDGMLQGVEERKKSAPVTVI